MRQRFIVAILSVLVVSFGSTAVAGDFLKALGKALEQAAREKAESMVEQAKDEMDRPCRNLESSAQVEEFDESRSSTWAVETTDGGKYQLRSLAIAGLTENRNNPNSYLGVASSISFTYAGSNDLAKRYRIVISYRDIAQGQSLLGQIVAAAANNTLREQLPTAVSVDVLRLEGKSLDGADWCLSSRARTIEFIAGSNETRREMCDRCCASRLGVRPHGGRPPD